MAYPYSPSRLRPTQPTSPSPLRHASTASSTSSASKYSYDSLKSPSRTSTQTSNASGQRIRKVSGHKRGLSEGPGTAISPAEDYFSDSTRSTPTNSFKSLREGLRPIPQAVDAPYRGGGGKRRISHGRSQSLEQLPKEIAASSYDRSPSPTPTPPKMRPMSMALSRGDSVRAPIHDRPTGGHRVRFSAQLEQSDLEGLKKSSTAQLRTLSKFANGAETEDFTIKSRDQEVVGLHGRRRLQRTDSTRAPRAAGYGGRTWMDTQRQFLQAYEYLCHIGEAKEWIEDIIDHPIPPIVQLEEALRDGVTLAEVVQSLTPSRTFRIFRNPKLQFRHSDNIAIFFRYLAEVELPELFRFELVDLYEKKNIPKVIYCIHALSWLLFRKGIVDFRIGNLVGQLQFEDHELEAMQKGLDKSGVSMPNFSGMSANFGMDPEPEPLPPEPVETEEERINRELAENEAMIVDLQAQIRGALLRMRLGELMQHLWDAEELLIQLQSKIRGDFAREVSSYRLDMRRFAVELQAAARGCLVRARERRKEAVWHSSETDIVNLQSLIRAKKSRAETQSIRNELRRHVHGIKEVQAAMRGALSRWDVGDKFYETREAEDQVVALQAAIRGYLARQQVDNQAHQIESAEAEAVNLQSAIRAFMARQKTDKQIHEMRNVEAQKAVKQLQAAARAMLQRRVHQTNRETLRQHGNAISILQAAARAAITRKHTVAVQEEVQQSTDWSTLQSVIRGQKVRDELKEFRESLYAESESVVELQAAIRAGRERQNVAALKEALEDCESSILDLQSMARAGLFRSKYQDDLKALQAATESITAIQSAARGCAIRQETYDTLCELNDHESTIVELQAAARAMLTRGSIDNVLSEAESFEPQIVELQALARAVMVQQKFEEKKRHFQENMEKVIKIQSFVRAKQQGESYRTLTTGQNPPVGTVKNFVHLLNDSDFDFDEEMEFERLRKTVVQHVRQNEMAEQYIDQLDIKIALLVKNKITLDEVIKHQKHWGGHVGSLLTNKEIASANAFDLKALNKNSRKKLEHYQELFFILQTQPQYMARMFRRIREQGVPEKECKRIEGLMMGLFGFAQKRREEYYLLKLLSTALREELSASASLQDYLRQSTFHQKVLSAYIRSPRDRKFLRDLLGPFIKENIIENEELDLESDPIQIHRSSINNEELRTGQRSRRNPDIPREEAIRDPETRETFIRHLQDLRDISDYFLAALEDLLPRMPYGIRYVAQQTYASLVERFPQEEPGLLLQLVGNWAWKTYFSPALMAPETWGVVDRGLSPLHKRNLGEVSKVLGQVALGRLFGGDNVYLQPMNTWVGGAIERVAGIWEALVNVRDPERQFDIDEFNDLYSRTKPTLYIKLADIFAIHQLVVQDLSYMCPDQNDVLREVIRELGSAKNNETEMSGVSSSEITLTLNPKLHETEDPDAPIKSLWMETKRCVLYIIRIQTGSNLLDIMVRPITSEDEDRWDALVHEEIAQSRSSKQRRAYTADHSAALDILHLTYAQLKRVSLENILQLESAGKISRHNHYQDLLNAIAVDIRTKHKRRMQRQRELEGVRSTLAALDEKSKYLEGQLTSYNDYIEQAMITLQSKKGKKRFLLPFTRQYNHERELARSGRTPRFGSFKYSARNLADKGVLVSWAGYSHLDHRTWDRLNLTISSDEVGVFSIEGSQGSMMIPGASAVVPLDDLLQAQFNNLQFITVFGDDAQGKTSTQDKGLKLNVNLLVHLIMKKFYKDG